MGEGLAGSLVSLSPCPEGGGRGRAGLGWLALLQPVVPSLMDAGPADADHLKAQEASEKEENPSSELGS